MARKFNTGRQNEIALNKEAHDLFMTLKYINNGPTKPIQDKQSPIPVGALWNDNGKGLNILKINKANGGWVPAFEGYYHPVNIKEKPLFPTDGQLWIDESQDNILKYYDQNTNSWIATRAMQTTAENVLVDMHNNFINIFPLKDMDEAENKKTYLVPYDQYGKLFDNGLFIHPTDSKYHKLSDVSVQ